MSDRKWFAFVDLKGDQIVVAAHRIISMRVRLGGDHQEVGATVKLDNGEEVEVQNTVKSLIAQL